MRSMHPVYSDHITRIGRIIAMIEYSVGIQLPDEVFEDLTLQSLLEAANDLMTWPNDICSFNVSPNFSL